MVPGKSAAMAQDDARVLTLARLKESYLQTQHQRDVMFATLNRVRQSLQDQGAQPLLSEGSDAFARNSNPDAPFLRMSNGPAAMSQQAVHHTTSLGTASGNVGLRSVNKVHGLLSPDQKRSLHPSAAQAKTSAHSQITNDPNASISVGKSQKHHDIARERQQAGSPARPSSWNPLIHQHEHIASGLHPSASPRHTAEQPAQPSRQQQQHSQGATSQNGDTHHNQNAPQQHQHDKPPPQSPEGPHPINGRARHKLDGVRQVKGGWEARIGRQGYSKAKETLGIHCTAYAAARAYDRALVTKRHPSQLSHSLNFPVQDYTAAESSSVSTAAVAAVKELHKLHAKLSGKRAGALPSQPPHLSPSTSRHRSGHAEPKHNAGSAFGGRKNIQPPPAQRSRTGQTAAEHSLQQRPVPAGPAFKADADQVNQHQKPYKPHGQKPAAVDALKAQPNGKAAVHGIDCIQHSVLEPNRHAEAQVPGDKRHSSEGKPHCRGSSPDANVAADTQHVEAALQQQSEPGTGGVAPGTAMKAAASALRAAGAAGNAERQDMHIPSSAQDHSMPHLNPVMCHTHRQTNHSEVDKTPSAPPHAQPTELHSMPQHVAASEQHPTGPGSTGHVSQVGDPISVPPTQPSAATTPLAAHVDSPRAGVTPTAGPLPSNTPETVRAGESDDDVEIMDDSPVHRSEPLSPASSSLQAMHTGTDGPFQHFQQQPGPEADEGMAPWEQAQEGSPPWAQVLQQQLPEQQLPQQLPEQQQCPEQDLLPERQQQSRSVQEQQQHGQSQWPQQQQKQQQQEQQAAEQQPAVEQQQPSWQPQPHKQPSEAGLDSAGLSSIHANLSKLSDFVDIVLTAAGHPPAAAAHTAGEAVKQEAVQSAARDSTPMPHSDVKACSAVAGSTPTHPVELSESDGGESDGDSSTSSSVDPSQRVPAPWLHADTAASRQQGASPGLSRVTARLAGHALHRQASEGSTLSNGHLRTKRGLSDTAAGPRSKLARVAGPAVPPSRVPAAARRGATAAEAVDLSDDDDDVVIIEENMQPQAAKGTDSTKRAGAAPATRPSHNFKPRVPAVARAALHSPPLSPAPPSLASQSKLHPQAPAGTHCQTSQAGQTDLQASSVLSATIAALRQAAGETHGLSSSAAAAESAQSAEASAAAAVGVAELWRTEQQSDPEFQAAQDLEWRQRQAVIEKQAEEAQRLKRQRRAVKEKKARQEAEVAKRLAEHRAEGVRKEVADQQKEQLRVRIRQQLSLKLGDAKSLRQVLTAFKIPIDGGFVATHAQLEKAYKKAMILFHPDKHVNKGLEKQLEAEESFKIISHARNRKSGK